MLTRRKALILALSTATTMRASNVGAIPVPGNPLRPARMTTHLFNFKNGISEEQQNEILQRLGASEPVPGVEGILIGRNLYAYDSPTRFEWIYMVQFDAESVGRQSPAADNFRRTWDELAAYRRNHVTCDLACELPPTFAGAVDVKVSHTVMFDFKPEAPVEARERNVAAIRAMGLLPMVRKYLVERAATPTPDPTQMEWQVVGDFASLADFKAYAENPAHLAIRDDFTAHTSRVAFLDVALT